VKKMDAIDLRINLLMKRFVERQQPDERIRQELLARAAGFRPLCSAVRISGPGEGSGREPRAKDSSEETGPGRACRPGGDERIARAACWAHAHAGLRPAV
jgi:hypothetical protein